MSYGIRDPRLRHTPLKLNQAQTLSLFASGAETLFGFQLESTTCAGRSYAVCQQCHQHTILFAQHIDWS